MRSVGFVAVLVLASATVTRSRAEEWPVDPGFRLAERGFPSLPAWPDGAFVLRAEDPWLHLVRGDRWWSLPLPPRPTRTTNYCGDVSTRKFSPPATVAFAPDGAVWFFQPVGGELNAWRWERGWHAVGHSSPGVHTAGRHDLRLVDPERADGRPAVLFQGEHAVVAWYHILEEQGLPPVVTTRIRRWEGADWRALEPVGPLPGASARRPPVIDTTETGEILVDGGAVVHRWHPAR